MNRSKKFLVKKLEKLAHVDQIKIAIGDDDTLSCSETHKHNDNLEFDALVINLESKLNE